MDPFLAHVAKSLGRDAVPTTVPPPPTIDESYARLARDEGGGDLSLKFTAAATAAKLHVHGSTEKDVVGEIVAHCQGQGWKAAIVTRCERFERLGLLAALKTAGIAATYWDETTLDASYEVDVGITDAWAGVAETGSVVLKSSKQHGRAVSLVPPFHIAVVGREQIVPDLIDAMHKAKAEGVGTGIVLITGPSKTSDIEMNLVVGVHGPGAVEVFLI